MKRNMLVFGLILGVILCIHMVITVNMMYNNPNFEGNHLVGYAILVVVFSLTFFGIRNYRNKQPNGIISFGKAFRIGALIALIGSTIYVIAWLFYYYLFVPDFLDVYSAFVLKEAAEQDPSSLAATTQKMESFKEMYKNPLFIILITYGEVLPVGLVVALISALILRKK